MSNIFSDLCTMYKLLFTSLHETLNHEFNLLVKFNRWAALKIKNTISNQIL